MSGQFDTMLGVIKKAESTITPWIDVDSGSARGYHDLLDKVRTSLVGQGVYDSAVVKLGERLAG